MKIKFQAHIAKVKAHSSRTFVDPGGKAAPRARTAKVKAHAKRGFAVRPAHMKIRDSNPLSRSE